MAVESCVHVPGADTVADVGVAVGVAGSADVGVAVGVAVGVDVGVAVGVAVGVDVGVAVGVAVGVDVGAGCDGSGGSVTVVAIIVTAVCDSARPVSEAPEPKVIAVLHKMIPLA